MARLFDSTNDYLEKTDNAGLSITGALTLFGWFMRNNDTPTQNEGLIAKYRSQTGSTNQRAYGLNRTAANVANFTISTDGTFQAGNSLTGSATWNHSTWTFIAGVLNPSVAQRIYVGTTPQNLALDIEDTSSVAASIADTAAPLWIGVQFDSNESGNYYGGRAAHCGVVAEALTLDQLKAIASGKTPMQVCSDRANVRGFWPLWGLQSPEIDLSGNDNDLTVNGAVAANHCPVRPYSPFAFNQDEVTAPAGGGGIIVGPGPLVGGGMLVGGAPIVHAA